MLQESNCNYFFKSVHIIPKSLAITNVDVSTIYATVILQVMALLSLQ